jgi:hypothetical protein
MDTSFSPSLEFKINSSKMLGKNKDGEIELENLKKIDPSFYSELKKFYETKNWKDFSEKYLMEEFSKGS